MIEKGKVRASDTAEYFLTNLDHPMNSGEQKKYMEGELHQYYHNRQEGWIHRWKARGENQKWSTAQDTGIPQLTTLRRKLDPLLGRFPEQFINILYSPDINTLRIRFHPQENKNEAFYRQMMSLLNSQL